MEKGRKGEVGSLSMARSTGKGVQAGSKAWVMHRTAEAQSITSWAGPCEEGGAGRSGNAIQKSGCPPQEDGRGT